MYYLAFVDELNRGAANRLRQWRTKRLLSNMANFLWIHGPSRSREVELEYGRVALMTDREDWGAAFLEKVRLLDRPGLVVWCGKGESFTQAKKAVIAWVQDGVVPEGDTLKIGFRRDQKP